VSLERGPFDLVSTIEELLWRNSSGSGLENRDDGRGAPLRWPRDTLYPQKLALISPTSGGRSVDIVRLRTKATEEAVMCISDVGVILMTFFVIQANSGIVQRLDHGRFLPNPFSSLYIYIYHPTFRHHTFLILQASLNKQQEKAVRLNKVTEAVTWRERHS
jgi:hypothetical protein